MQFIKKLLRYNLWFEHDVVWIGSEKYLERWFMYFLGFTIRLHKFYRGDDDRAPHDHPWAFITFPLTGYWEKVPNYYGDLMPQYVAPFRFHYRPAWYQHIVIGANFCRGQRGQILVHYGKPFYTVVLTSRKQRSWGFWPQIDVDSTGTIRCMFVYWRDFNASR